MTANNEVNNAEVNLKVTKPKSKVEAKGGWARRIARSCGGCSLLLVIGLVTLAGMIYFKSQTPDLVIPTPIMPTDNGYDDFVHAGRLAQAMRHQSPYSMPGLPAQTMTLRNFKACAKDAIPIEAALQQGLNKKFLCPPVRSAKTIQFTDFALIRETARALAGKARYEALSGHPGQAADTLLDGYAMAVTLPRGGTIITLLMGIACEAIACRPLETVLPSLNEQELAHVALRLDKIAAGRVPLADILTEEGNVSAAMFLEMMHNPKNRGLGGLEGLGQIFGGGLNGSVTMEERMMALSYLFKDKNVIALQHQAFYKALAAESRLPYNTVSAVKTGNDPMLAMAAQTMTSIRGKYIGLETVGILLRTVTALERYRRAHGIYPADLNALVPAYLKSVPVDICTGKANLPLHYSLQGIGKASERSYLLYNVGIDMRDDGGSPQKNVADGTHGDIVAHHLWWKTPAASASAKK